MDANGLEVAHTAFCSPCFFNLPGLLKFYVFCHIDDASLSARSLTKMSEIQDGVRKFRVGLDEKKTIRPSMPYLLVHPDAPNSPWSPTSYDFFAAFDLSLFYSTNLMKRSSEDPQMRETMHIVTETLRVNDHKQNMV